MISIIIPAFNSEQTLAACLDSLLEQTFAEKEIIVVDGLSSDGTLAILKEYAARFPALRYTSEKDKGIYDAINKGIHLSKGEWIYILGSDDRLFESSTLQKVNTQLQGIKTGLVYGNVLVEGDAGWAADGEIYGGEFTLGKLLERNICQQAVFYHRSLFTGGKMFHYKYKVCADWDFMLYCAARFPMKYIDLTVAGFAGGGTSNSLSDPAFEKDFTANLYRYFGRKLAQQPFEPFTWRFRDLARENLKKGKLLSAAQIYFIYRKHLARKEQRIKESKA